MARAKEGIWLKAGETWSKPGQRLRKSPMATVRAELRTFQWLARHYDGFILDQYGVLHNGGDPLPGALACLAHLRSEGQSFCINSNSATSAESTLEKLCTVRPACGV